MTNTESIRKAKAKYNKKPTTKLTSVLRKASERRYKPEQIAWA